MKELSYLNKYFIKYKFSFSFGILITIIAQIFFLFTPKLVSHSFDVIEKFLKLSDADKKYSMLVDFYQQELIHNVLLITGSAIIGGFLTFLMRQT